MSEPTEGTWEFIPGEPGFMGSMEEPPEPSYPPTIVAHTDKHGDIEIAELREPISESANFDPDCGPEFIGDDQANGKLMAASKDLKRHLEAVVESFWGDWAEEHLREHFRTTYEDHPMMKAERFLKDL